MNTIFGYDVKNARERVAHHKKLLRKYPHLKTELEIVYSWMNNPDFVSAVNSPTKNQLEWLKKSMEHPPERLLNHLIAKTTKTITLQSLPPVKKSTKSASPLCFSCCKRLANDMLEVCEFSTICCDCYPKTFHNECADDYIMKTTSCSKCAKNLKIKRHFSSIQATLK